MAVIARTCPRCEGSGRDQLPSRIAAAGRPCPLCDGDGELLPARQLAGAVDALDFALRTVSDPDLSEAEIRERIDCVARRTLDRIGAKR